MATRAGAWLPDAGGVWRAGAYAGHFLSGDHILVRGLQWGMLWVGLVACAASAQPGPGAPGLQVSPRLNTHDVRDDAPPASFLFGERVHTTEDGRLLLRGQAEVRRIDAVVKGDEIEYEEQTGQLKVRGQGLLMRDASIVVGPDMQYNVNRETGEINDADFWLGASGGAGSAERAEIFSHDHMRLTRASYSGCPCPQPEWHIESSRVDLYMEANEGRARNGVLYFKGVPLLYSPYLTFPLRPERKSGFLIPTYGSSSKSGFDFSLPYYFNLAPNYDATLTPRYLGKRGLQLGAEFRYLGRGYAGQLYGTYLAHDRNAGRNRWYYAAQHWHQLGGGVTASMDVRRVSDDDYFRDFSSFGLNEATVHQLPSYVRLDWAGGRYFSASLMAQTYQTLQDRDGDFTLPEYHRLPELKFTAARYQWNGFDVVSENTVTRFHRPMYRGDIGKFAGFRHQRLGPDGTRYTSYSTLAYPIVRAGWYVRPQVGLHMTHYDTQWHTRSLPHYANHPRSESRVLPLMSVDAGMTFERQGTLFGKAVVQTLEPRAYYLYVPYRDQSTMPVYDTALATFNFSQAFSENLYSGGWDRIADAHQLTLGLTSRWLDSGTGAERMSLSMAQRHYFRDQHVTLPGETPRKGQRSDYLLGASAALTDTFSVRFSAQFNPESRHRNRMTAGFRWSPQRLTSLSATYRYERDPRAFDNPGFVTTRQDDRTREQISLAGQWPLSRNVYALGRLDYSLQEKRSTQTIFGLEYKGDCCWAARVVAQRYAVSASDVNTAFFFQLELSGLGSLGSDPMNLLRERISGYQPIVDPVPLPTTFERYQ